MFTYSKSWPLSVMELHAGSYRQWTTPYDAKINALNTWKLNIFKITDNITLLHQLRSSSAFFSI